MSEAHHRPSFWHALREHATHWAVGGLLIAATGFAPEEWFARTVEHLHIPENALHLWSAGIDVRIVPIGVGVAFIVGDLLWRKHKPRLIAAASDPGSIPLLDRPSVAVLPFDNLSKDSEQEYFSDGIADDIITELSRSHVLFVIARNSSFTYRGRAVDVKQVARELGVRYVIEGSVRREADRVRINAQLIDAETGNHIWAERYDRALEHVFAVQDEITTAIVTAIQPAVADAELRRMLRKTPGNLSAWEAYQQGLWHVSKASRAATEQARELFRRAIELDPGFAPACTALASVYISEGTIHAMRPVAEALQMAGEWARKAVAIDPNDADAQAILARVSALLGDHEQGWERALLALALNPNSPVANLTRAAALIYGDSPSEGRDYLITALRLDPRNPRNSTAMNQVVISYYIEHDYAAAVDWAKRSIARYPDDPRAYRWLAATLGQLGQIDEARTALHHAIKISPSSFDFYVRQRQPWISEKAHTHMLEGLRKAGWQG